jgi:hypothetical protein
MSLLRFLFAKAYVPILDRCVLGEHRGIRICTTSLDRGKDGEFLRHTKLALDLLASSDPARFRRVHTQVRYIVNSELDSLAVDRPGRICSVDFGRFETTVHRSIWVPWLAGLLVHVATHGLLRAKGIKPTKANWKQIAQICHAEQNRFLAKAEEQYEVRLQRKFEMPPDGYGFWYRWLRTKRMVTRMRQEGAKARRSVEPPP